jgi:hypothetical protein
LRIACREKGKIIRVSPYNNKIYARKSPENVSDILARVYI